MVLIEEKPGDEIAADDEKDEYAGGAIKDGKPDGRDVVVEAEALEGMESHDQEDG